MTEPCNFEHQRIDPTMRSIRLINIDSEMSPDGYIQCDMIHTTLEATYQCLSYRWGDDQPSYTVLIRYASEDARPFKVRKSLYDFLCRCRTEIEEDIYAMAGTTSLWVDALCIDQTSTSERNHQIGQMDEVFHNAQRVIVWLGETMQPASGWGDLIETIRFKLFRSPVFPHYHHLPCPISDLCHICRCSSFMKYVCENEYWNRAWVTQELILAQRVYLLLVGRLFEFSTVARHYIGNEPPGRFLRLRQMMPCVQYRARVPILTLLNELRGKLCSRPYDRVYSILGLVEEQYLVKVDYRQSPAALALDILRSCGTKLCLCAVLLVTQVLGVRKHDFSTEFEDSYLFVVIGGFSSVSRGFGGTNSCPQLRVMLARCKDVGLETSTVVKQDWSDDPLQIVHVPFSACASGFRLPKIVGLCEHAKSGRPATPVCIGVDLRTEADVARHEATFRDNLLPVPSSLGEVAKSQEYNTSSSLSEVARSLDYNEPSLGEVPMLQNYKTPSNEFVDIDIQSRFIQTLRSQAMIARGLSGVSYPMSSFKSRGFVTPALHSPGQWTLSLSLRRPLRESKDVTWLDNPSKFGEQLALYVAHLLENLISGNPADFQAFIEGSGHSEASAQSFTQLVAQFRSMLAQIAGPGYAERLALTQWRFFIALHLPLPRKRDGYFDLGEESKVLTIWMECLEDLHRHRTTLMGENGAGQQAWPDAVDCWYLQRKLHEDTGRSSTVYRIYRHLAKLAHPDTFQPLCGSE